MLTEEFGRRRKDERQKTQDKRHKTQDKRHKTQDKRQKTQDKRQKTQDTGDLVPLPGEPAPTDSVGGLGVGYKRDKTKVRYTDDK